MPEDAALDPGGTRTAILQATPSIVLHTQGMVTIDYSGVRAAIAGGRATIEVSPLDAGAIDAIAWSGSPTHLENVVSQLRRVDAGEVAYLVLSADGLPVAKGGIDLAKEDGAGTIMQLATHPELEGLGLATRLIAELEQRALDRGLQRLRLAVELDEPRALRLYEHLGYRRIGTSDASWEAEADDGARYLYSTTLMEMEKSV